MTPELIAVLATALLPNIVMLWLSRGAKKVDNFETRLGAVENRLASLEAKESGRGDFETRLDTRLSRIEERLDRLVERPHAGA
jgi:hypothetical protein